MLLLSSYALSLYETLSVPLANNFSQHPLQVKIQNAYREWLHRTLKPIFQKTKGKKSKKSKKNKVTTQTVGCNRSALESRLLHIAHVIEHSFVGLTTYAYSVETKLLIELARILSTKTKKPPISHLLPNLVFQPLANNYPSLETLSPSILITSHIHASNPAYLIPISWLSQISIDEPLFKERLPNPYLDVFSLTAHQDDFLPPFDIQRLYHFNAKTQEILHRKQEYLLLRDGGNSLLSHLTLLNTRLKANSAHGGRGTVGETAFGSYDALAQFATHYHSLPPEEIARIPSAIQQQLNNIFYLGADPNRAFSATCTGTMHDSALTPILENQEYTRILASIPSHTNPTPDRLLQAKEAFQRAVQDLLSSPAHIGSDLCTVTPQILQHLCVTDGISSYADIQSLQSLPTETFVALFKAFPNLSQKLFQHLVSIEEVILFINPLSVESTRAFFQISASRLPSILSRVEDWVALLIPFSGEKFETILSEALPYFLFPDLASPKTRLALTLQNKVERILTPQQFETFIITCANIFEKHNQYLLFLNLCSPNLGPHFSCQILQGPSRRAWVVQNLNSCKALQGFLNLGLATNPYIQDIMLLDVFYQSLESNFSRTLRSMYPDKSYSVNQLISIFQEMLQRSCFTYESHNLIFSFLKDNLHEGDLSTLYHAIEDSFLNPLFQKDPRYAPHFFRSLLHLQDLDHNLIALQNRCAIALYQSSAFLTLLDQAFVVPALSSNTAGPELFCTYAPTPLCAQYLAGQLHQYRRLSLDTIYQILRQLDDTHYNLQTVKALSKSLLDVAIDLEMPLEDYLIDNPSQLPVWRETLSEPLTLSLLEHIHSQDRLLPFLSNRDIAHAFLSLHAQYESIAFKLFPALLEKMHAFPDLSESFTDSFSDFKMFFQSSDSILQGFLLELALSKNWLFHWIEFSPTELPKIFRFLMILWPLLSLEQKEDFLERWFFHPAVAQYASMDQSAHGVPYSISPWLEKDSRALELLSHSDFLREHFLSSPSALASALAFTPLEYGFTLLTLASQKLDHWLENFSTALPLSRYTHFSSIATRLAAPNLSQKWLHNFHYPSLKSENTPSLLSKAFPSENAAALFLLTLAKKSSSSSDLLLCAQALIEKSRYGKGALEDLLSHIQVTKKWRERLHQNIEVFQAVLSIHQALKTLDLWLKECEKKQTLRSLASKNPENLYILQKILPPEYTEPLLQQLFLSNTCNTWMRSPFSMIKMLQGLITALDKMPQSQNAVMSYNTPGKTNLHTLSEKIRNQISTIFSKIYPMPIPNLTLFLAIYDVAFERDLLPYPSFPRFSIDRLMQQVDLPALVANSPSNLVSLLKSPIDRSLKKSLLLSSNIKYTLHALVFESQRSALYKEEWLPALSSALEDIFPSPQSRLIFDAQWIAVLPYTNPTFEEWEGFSPLLSSIGQKQWLSNLLKGYWPALAKLNPAQLQSLCRTAYQWQLLFFLRQCLFALPRDLFHSSRFASELSPSVQEFVHGAMGHAALPLPSEKSYPQLTVLSGWSHYAGLFQDHPQRMDAFIKWTSSSDLALACAASPSDSTGFFSNVFARFSLSQRVAFMTRACASPITLFHVAKYHPHFMISQVVDFIGPETFQKDFALPLMYLSKLQPQSLGPLIQAIDSVTSFPSLPLSLPKNVSLLFSSAQTTPSAFNTLLKASYQPKGFLGWRTAPADLNILDKHGNTLLIKAVMSCNFEMVEHLLDRNVELLKHKNNSGQSAYEIAFSLNAKAIGKEQWPSHLLDRLQDRTAPQPPTVQP